MNYQITCSICTVVNYVKKSTDTYCYLCGNELPKLDQYQIANIIEANKREQKIYETIKKARDIIPETYICSPSIFITGKINDYTIKFLIDTGAQMSVIPQNVAIACELNDIIDESYCGKIKGVGHDKVMGRIHYVEVNFDWGILPCSFTICKNPDLIPIIGIDILNSHGVIINFKTKCLEIGTNKIKW